MFFGLNDVGFLAAVSAPAIVLDPDAAVYIAAVEAADTQALEPAVRAAINDFVVGCKADGIWAAIKASCILAGARTLTGALVPLVGAAPTNVNFVSGDYNRKTGLVGDGSTKYLDSNRNNNADPQNNQHCSAYCSSRSTVNTFPTIMGVAQFGQSGWSSIFQQRGLRWEGNSRGNNIIQGTNENQPAFLGVSRSSGSLTVFRGPSFSITGTAGSTAPGATPWLIYRDANSANLSNARIAFYSIGESLALSLLDARVTALINAFDAAI
jgi:hypothetical protein